LKRGFPEHLSKTIAEDSGGTGLSAIAKTECSEGPVFVDESEMSGKICPKKAMETVSVLPISWEFQENLKIA